MLDFTSALYLGMRHSSDSLEPWVQLTTGVPAALQTPPGALSLAATLAELQGCERATLRTSTLHLFWDLFGMLAGEGIAIYRDEGLYPIARWGIERASARGVRVQSFRHHDVKALRSLRAQHRSSRARPVIVVDGYCPGCARPAPLEDYWKCAQEFGGYLIMDDTQALGIFGQAPRKEQPYGNGGGGMLRWHNLTDRRVLVTSSLAKGFGVPVAALSGTRNAIDWFERRSETSIHCSPPSNAALSAVAHALDVNRDCGDALRTRLANLIGIFRRKLQAIGLTTRGGLFPVQTIERRGQNDAAVIHQRLLRQGIRTVLHSASAEREEARVSFIITARHSIEMIDRAVCALGVAAGK